MKKVNRILAFLLVLAMVIPGFAFAEDVSSALGTKTNVLTEAIEKFKHDEETDRLKLDIEPEEFYEDEDEVRIIVELKSDPSVVQATERNLRYEQMPESSIKGIERKINEEQVQVKRQIESVASMKYINSFNTAFNGFSGMVKFKDIKAIEDIPKVNKVYIANEYKRPEIEPDMETSKDMVGTLPTWDIGYKGEGTVVAIIDTGIDPSHRDMVLSDDTTPKILRETLECKNLLGGYYTEKVPYGYNYYDLNNEILDLAPNASMHGMHVAGTVGANGDEENGGIKGVAPECQLLAMKVFSNDPIYATTFSDIYMEAIDEAIKLGADVLNMSLGSTAAFYIPDSAEDVSITNAVNNGIVCSVSAGNSGSMTYGWTNTNSGYPLKENPDIGVVGSPGLNKDTLQVAAIENTHQKSNALVYTKDGEEHKIAMAIAGNISPMEVFSGPQEFVDGGSGHPSELTGVAGKVALVVRGGLTSNFVDKIANAQAAGAIGVIVRNHETGGEALVNMATPDVQTIPAVFIGYTSGMELLGLENKEVLFSDELVSVANPDAWLMADFTSWGVTPSLELKPEITAPGVQIYSTLNGDKYGTMSGTSMAAPHVSGGAALVKEYIQRNKAYQNMSLSEQTRLAKVLMMNTAIPVNDEYETEYSPRRQGAGIMNLYGAVTTPVRLVDEKTNEAKVELKDFESTQFTMKFKAINDSASDETYNVDVKVMTDYIHPLGINLLSSDYIYDAQIDKPDLITVPANGETTFDVTVNIGADDTIYRNMFVEGFVVLTDPDDENPDISVPYVGFYGEWDEPAIVDGMMFIDHEGSSYFGLSGMTYWDEEGEGYYYTEPHIFMNPGTPAGTKLGTGNIVPYLSFMRNAETVKYNILDSEENNLRTILMEQYRVKNYFNGGNNNPVSMIIRAKWDGKINGAVVPDGDYFYEIAANIHYDGAAVQSKKIPITIDTVGPAISNLAYNATTNKLTWDSEDKGAGILGFMFNINGEEIEKVVDGEAGKTSYELDMNSYVEEAGEYNVVVTSVDKIYNMASGEITFNVERAYPYIYIMEPGLLEIYDYSEVLFEGYVTNFPMLDKVLINNIEADIEYFDSVNLYSPDEPSKLIYSGPAFKFTKILNLADGYQEAKIEAISSKGKGSNLVRRFYVDTTDPELSVDVLNINKELKTAELEISMKDNLGYLELFIGDSQIYVYEYPLVIQQPANQVMNYTVNLKEGENTFEFTLVDGSGHSTIQTASIELNSDEEPKEPSITNLEPSSDVELEPGGALTISFNAPAGGLAYYRILLPLGMQKSSYGTSMDEQAPGLYTAVWVAPEKLTASNLAIEVVYVAKDGSEIHEIAEGKISVMGAINDIPVNTIIIGDEAFDMDFINTNADAQKKVVEWFNHGGELFVKINYTTIVDADGSMVDIDELPDLIAYYDMDGNIIYYEK